jgi:hypothetical protein
MPLKNIIEAIEKKQSLYATELLEKSLYNKAGILLEEKKKQVAAKTWPARNITKSDDKAKSKADRRKMLKEKLKKEKVEK